MSHRTKLAATPAMLHDAPAAEYACHTTTAATDNLMHSWLVDAVEWMSMSCQAEFTYDVEAILCQ